MASIMKGTLVPSNILSGTLKYTYADHIVESVAFCRDQAKASVGLRKSSLWGSLESFQAQAIDMRRRFSGLTVKHGLCRCQAVATPTAKTLQRVFTFGKARSEGNKSMKSLLGGKGANLAEMASIGLSVPPGLTISTEACREYLESGNKLPDGLWEEVLEGLKTVEKDMNAYLGDPSRPLLLSVRSGAAR